MKLGDYFFGRKEKQQFTTFEEASNRGQLSPDVEQQYLQGELKTLRKKREIENLKRKLGTERQQSQRQQFSYGAPQGSSVLRPFGNVGISRGISGLLQPLRQQKQGKIVYRHRSKKRKRR